MDKNITPEVLEKAKQILGLAASDQAVEAKQSTELEKAEQDLLSAQAKVEELKSGKTDKKPETAQDNTELIKAVNDKFQALGELILAKDSEIDGLKKANDDLAGEIKKINEFNKAFGEKIGMLAKAPQDRKSISGTVKAVERFEKGENGQELGAGTAAEGKQVFSLSNKDQRAALSSTLFDFAVQDNKIVDQEFAKAAQYVELGTLGANVVELQRIQARLAQKGIVVTK